MGEKQNSLFQVTLIGFSSAVLYGIIYFVQQSIFLNGLLIKFGDIVIQGTPRDKSHSLFQIAAYVGATVALFALYLWLLMLCRQGRLQNNSKRENQLVLLFPVLFNIGLLLGRPYFSIDVFSYITHGYLGNLPGGNPYVQPSLAGIHTPFAADLVSFGWRPVHGITPYGPLWTLFENTVVGLTSHHIPTAMLLIKAFVVAASLGSAALIWVTLGKVCPGDQLFGTLLYLWNPVVIIEFAAEGHNDAVMILFVLAALALNAYARPGLANGSLALSVLTKYLPLIFVLPQLFYLWRSRRNWREIIQPLVVGLVISAMFAMLFYWPFWIGSATFLGTQLQSQPRISALPSGALAWYFSLNHTPKDAAKMASIIIKCVFLGLILLNSWYVRDLRSLFKAIATIALIYVLAITPVYWPWYVCLPLAIIALTPHGTLLQMGLVVTLLARLVAPLEIFYLNGFLHWQWLDIDTVKNVLGATLPFIILLLLYGRQHFQRRLVKRHVS